MTSKPPLTEDQFYGKLSSPEVADAARQAAKDIKELTRSQNKTIVEIGQKLIEVKKSLDHGEFGGWLQLEFKWSHRTADRYMSVVEHLGGHFDTVSNLNARTIYALAAKSTPDEVRDEIVERLTAGDELSDRDIMQEISDAKPPRTRGAAAKGHPDANAEIEKLRRELAKAQERLSEKFGDGSGDKKQRPNLQQATKLIDRVFSRANSAADILDSVRAFHRLAPCWLPSEIFEEARWSEAAE
jgi:hypothetical protein